MAMRESRNSESKKAIFSAKRRYFFRISFKNHPFEQGYDDGITQQMNAHYLRYTYGVDLYFIHEM